MVASQHGYTGVVWGLGEVTAVVHSTASACLPCASNTCTYASGTTKDRYRNLNVPVYHALLASLQVDSTISASALLTLQLPR